jgi:hypothetical protein
MPRCLLIDLKNIYERLMNDRISLSMERVWQLALKEIDTYFSYIVPHLL